MSTGKLKYIFYICHLLIGLYNVNSKKRILIHNQDDVFAELMNLKTKIEAMKKQMDTMQTTITTLQNSGLTGGSTYVRWGRKTCPGNGTELIYSGFTAGSHYTHTGAASNYVCLSPEPKWGKYEDALYTGWGALIYGAEYEIYADRSRLFFGEDIGNQDVPCAVCRSPRSSVLMIPGRNTCHGNDWNLEYHGYLTAGATVEVAASEYVCLDSKPEYTISGAADQNGKLFYLVEGQCGSLECPPYINNRELTCAVCTK